MPMYLKMQTHLSLFINLFWQVKTFLCQSLGLLGFFLESSGIIVCSFGAGFEFVTESTVGSVVSGFITRGLGSCGSCLGPGWM